MSIRKPTETDLIKPSLQLLAMRGAFAWRNNTGGMPTPSGGFIRFGTPGSGDIFAVLPDGRFLTVELKCGKNKVTPAEAAFMAQVRDRGGVCIVAYSITELDALLKETME